MDALRPLLDVTQSVTGCIPTRERGNDLMSQLPVKGGTDSSWYLL